KEKTLSVIFFYIIYCVLNEAAVFYFHEQDIKNDFIVFAIFTIVEFSFFGLFYYYAMPAGWMKKAVLPIWSLFFIFSCIDFFLINQMNAFDSITSGVESIFIILLCIYYLAVQLKGTNNLFVYSTSNFWIIITFLIYLSGTFFLYIMTENMIQDRAFRIQYLIINSVFNILKNILLSIAMLMKETPPNEQAKKNKNWDEMLSYNLKN
ncbi:MAG: hypothetical protein ACXVNN_09625, partial [Bacteroidia bacterium]